MKKPGLLGFVIIAIFFIFNWPVFANSISSYNVTCELIENNRSDYASCLMNLEITYNITEPTSQGRIHLNKSFPYYAVVIDADGNELDFEVKKELLYTLVWDYDQELSDQEYTVNIEFQINDVVAGAQKRNVLALDWPGEMGEEVSNATYSVIFPDEFILKNIKTKPSKNKKEYLDDGSLMVSTKQDKLTEKQFYFEYKPGLIKNPVGKKVEETTWVDFIPYFAVGFLLVVLAFVVYYFTGRKKEKTLPVTVIETPEEEAEAEPSQQDNEESDSGEVPSQED